MNGKESCSLVIAIQVSVTDLSYTLFSFRSQTEKNAHLPKSYHADTGAAHLEVQKCPTAR